MAAKTAPKASKEQPTPSTPSVDPEVGTPSTTTPEKLSLTYEQARDELIDVVNRLESGGESLAESMELFKRGQALAGLCEHYLSEARATVEATKEA